MCLSLNSFLNQTLFTVILFVINKYKQILLYYNSNYISKRIVLSTKEQSWIKTAAKSNRDQSPSETKRSHLGFEVKLLQRHLTLINFPNIQGNLPKFICIGVFNYLTQLSFSWYYVCLCKRINVVSNKKREIMTCCKFKDHFRKLISLSTQVI